MNPYPSIAARRAGFKINFTLSSDFAIAADMGPGGGLATNVLPNASRRDMASVNSPNHGGDGQNVLYADGHVEFAASPYAGSPRPLSQQPRDNIYTFGVSSTTSAGTGVRGASQDQYDSVILPTALDGPQPPPAAFSGGALLWALRGVAVLIVAVTAVV